MSAKTSQSPVITKAEAAQIMGVEEKSVTHIEGEVDGKNLCLKQLPGLYSRVDAEAIRDARAAAAKAKAEAKAAKEAQVKREVEEEEAKVQAQVERHEPTKGNGIAEVEKALKASIEAGETS